MAVLFTSRPPHLEQSSQHLPLKGKHNVDHLQAAGDFFQDAVLLPQLVQLPVALWAKVQWIAPSKVRISLPIIIQVRSGVSASSSLTGHQYNFTLSYPEEHAHPGSTGSSVGGAGPHILSIQLAEAAGALRAQHGPAEQAQGRVLPVIVCGLGALKMACLIEESTVILRKINQTIPSSGVSDGLDFASQGFGNSWVPAPPLQQWSNGVSVLLEELENIGGKCQVAA